MEAIHTHEPMIHQPETGDHLLGQEEKLRSITDIKTQDLFTVSTGPRGKRGAGGSPLEGPPGDRHSSVFVP